MNQKVRTLIQELDDSRREMRRRKEMLKVEANPVRRLQRSWTGHKSMWIACGAAAAGLFTLLLFRRRKARPLVPPGYVMGAPARPANRWWSLLSLAGMFARPALEVWARKKTEALKHQRSRSNSG
jgi:hypothetical protein